MAIINKQRNLTQRSFDPSGLGRQSFFSQNKWPIIIISLSILVIFAIIWFAFLRKKPAQSGPPKVNLGIEAPNQLPSGSEIIYKVHVSNSDGVGIKNVLLDLIYPAGFNFTESTPKPSKLNGTQFALPDIDSGQDLTVMVKGHLQGNASENKTITGMLHYTPQNFNSEFIAQAAISTAITTANVSLDFSGPGSANTDQSLTYILNYANFVANPIVNFKITLTVPQAFKVDKYDPVPTLGSTWNLGTLQSNQTGAIKITGTFIGSNIGDRQTFTAKSEGDTGTGATLALSANQYLVTITPIALQSQLVLFSGQQQDVADAVTPGASLQYKVTYQNNSATPAHGVILSVNLEGEGYDFASIQAQQATINNGAITWDASQNSQFESLQPNASGDFTFSVRVKDPATKHNQKNIALKATAQMRSNDYAQPFQSKPVDLKIATVPVVAGQVSYFDGAHPPKVNQNTSYKITITLRNATNEIINAKVTMNLPNAFVFNGVVPGSPEQSGVSYDSGTKKLTWNVDKLSANAGTFSPLRKLEFLMAINPGPASADQIVTLVNNINFSGTDSFTGQKLQATISDLTTGNDTAGQGTVQP